MPGIVVSNWPAALVIFLFIVGGGIWLSFRLRHGPDYREARIHFRAKRNPGTAATTSDYVPSDRVVATDGLTVPSSSLDDLDEDPRDRGTAAPDGGAPRSPQPS